MAGRRVDVCCHHIRLDTVDLSAFQALGMVDRIEHVQQRMRPVVDAELRKCENHPAGGVRILPAVLAYARRVALDIPGIERGFVKGRGEKHRYSVAWVDQLTI